MYIESATGNLLVSGVKAVNIFHLLKGEFINEMKMLICIKGHLVDILYLKNY